MAKNSKKTPLFCEYFCLVPLLDHSGLTAGEYVESILQGRGRRELRPPHFIITWPCTFSFATSAYFCGEGFWVVILIKLCKISCFYARYLLFNKWAMTKHRLEIRGSYNLKQWGSGAVFFPLGAHLIAVLDYEKDKSDMIDSTGDWIWWSRESLPDLFAPNEVIFQRSF